MNIVIIGRGDIGAGLAMIWRRRGHIVSEVRRTRAMSPASDAVLLASLVGRLPRLRRPVSAASLGRR